MDLWTAQELGGPPGDFQAEPGRPGTSWVEVEVRRVSGKQAGTSPPRAPRFCVSHVSGLHRRGVQREESMAEKQGLQTPGVAHTPPGQTFN